jgi:exodeoxyribonuclease VII small subunit
MDKELREEEVKFEDALARLEEIVQSLESGNLSLEESLALYEEGMRLSSICSKKLSEAELRIQVLTKEEELSTKPVKSVEKIEINYDS